MRQRRLRRTLHRTLPPARVHDRGSLPSTPLVVDGVMYIGTAYNRVVALDAETGKEIWVKDIGQTPSTRGIAYWPGTRDTPPRLVFGTADGSSLLDLPRRQDWRICARVRTQVARSIFDKASARNFRSCAWRCRRRPRFTAISSSRETTHKKRPASGRPATCARGICGRESSSGRSTPCPDQVSRIMRPGATTNGSIVRAPMRGALSLSTRVAGLLTFPLEHQPPISTAATGLGRIYMGHRSSHSTPSPAS